MTTGADGPIRVSVILANRSGVNAGGRLSLSYSKAAQVAIALRRSNDSMSVVLARELVCLAVDTVITVNQHFD